MRSVHDWKLFFPSRKISKPDSYCLHACPSVLWRREFQVLAGDLIDAEVHDKRAAVSNLGFRVAFTVVLSFPQTAYTNFSIFNAFDDWSESYCKCRDVLLCRLSNC